MEAYDVALVRISFLRLIPLSDVAGKIFLERLILIEPELIPLVHRRSAYGGTAITRALAIMVEGLSRPSRTARLAKRIGYRYAKLGVTAEHYPAIREAFLWTIERVLDDAEKSETREAWCAAHDLISKGMEEGARCQRAQCPT